jgi:diaminopimelate decarboxylase
MPHFSDTHVESLPFAELAERFGTPLYVYSRAALTQHFLAFQQALSHRPHQICYAVKANANIAVLNVLARLGAGFDIVSRGELERVLAAGGMPEKVVFSGVGKLDHEIERALAVGIGCFNVESAFELTQLNSIATGMQKTANIAIRINPDIDAQTHPYISTGLKENKFGIPWREAFALYQKASRMPNINTVGLACHIGSQLTQLAPFIETFDQMYAYYLALKNAGILIKHIDLGGGLGVCYQQEIPPTPQAYVAALLARMTDPSVEILISPGRAIAANAGVLLARVIHLKQVADKNFAVVDAAMNDLIRPALYQIEHAIVPVNTQSNAPKRRYDIVGPICETGDFLGKNRDLALEPGDLLTIRAAGAYGFSMSSHYNSRPSAAEIMVDQAQAYVVRDRETLASLFAGEHCLP